MMELSDELDVYVERRARLAGSAVLPGRSPYNLEVDRLAEEASAAGAKFLSLANYDYLGLAASGPRASSAATGRFTAISSARWPSSSARRTR
jgi:7-keto-8-aminopelargonate synthetase-like enzyme